MSRPIPIFYEDDWGAVKEFGLHELLVSSIADAKKVDYWTLRPRFEAIPKKGDSRLLAACRDDVPDMPDEQIFALFDGDKLHKLLYDSGRPEADEMLEELKRRCPDERLEIFLIFENTESVVNAAADCLREARPAKNKLLRDRLLLKIARLPSQDGRDCVRSKVPSFDECVKAIASVT